MKYPDALRVLCRDILDKHLPAEREAFEAVGEELLDGRDFTSSTESVARAEFGNPLEDDLAIVTVAAAMKRTVDAFVKAKSDPAASSVIERWQAAMIKDGVEPDVASSIAVDFGARLVACVSEARASRGATTR